MILAVFATACVVATAPAASAGAPAPIVFERGGDLFTYRIGGDVHRMTHTDARESGPVWAPGHRRLAFVRWGTRVATLELRTGATRSVARLPAKFDEIGALAWSTDGSQIAIAANNEFMHEGIWTLSGTVWTVGADGRDLTRVVGGQGLVTGLGWGPDGRLFASTDWPNGVELWNPDALLGVVAIDAGGGDPRLISGTKAGHLDLSQDGRRVVFRGWVRTCHACGEIWRMSADGSGAHVIAMPPDGVYGLSHPRFSPAGSRIAVLAAGRRSSMWIMRADGSRLHRVLTDVRSIDW
jgi:Tol biopolymer transport system component